MNDYKDLEEANKEVERSKTILHDSENIAGDKSQEVEKSGKDLNEAKEGSGIFTTDGKELPNVEGGYDFIEPGGTLGDDEFVST